MVEGESIYLATYLTEYTNAAALREPLKKIGIASSIGKFITIYCVVRIPPKKGERSELRYAPYTLRAAKAKWREFFIVIQAKLGKSISRLLFKLVNLYGVIPVFTNDEYFVPSESFKLAQFGMYLNQLIPFNFMPSKRGTHL